MTTLTISTTFWNDHASRMDDNLCRVVKAGAKRTTVEGNEAEIANLLSDAEFYVSMGREYTNEGYGHIVGAAKRTVDAIKRQMNPEAAAAPTYWKPTPALPAHPEAPTADELMTWMTDCLKEHGLDEKGWTARLNTKAKSVYGRCFYRERFVEVSWQIARLNPPAETLDCVRHEVAHALAGHAAGHGPLWKEMCLVTGASPTRCYDSKKVATPWTWALVCEGCGQVAARRKKQPRNNLGYSHRRSACSASQESGRLYGLRPVHRRELPHAV